MQGEVQDVWQGQGLEVWTRRPEPWPLCSAKTEAPGAVSIKQQPQHLAKENLPGPSVRDHP